MKKEIKKNIITYATIGAITATGLGVGAATLKNHYAHAKYTVKPGDTLSEICEYKYGDSSVYEIVARHNHINPDKIYSGQEIYLPCRVNGNKYDSKSLESKTYRIIPGDTLYDICIREYDDGSLSTRLAVYNGKRDADIIMVGETIMIPPYETLINVELPRSMRIK